MFRIESGSAYNNIKRGIEFLKSKEQTYENSDEYIKQKIFNLSKCSKRTKCPSQKM